MPDPAHADPGAAGIIQQATAADEAELRRHLGLPIADAADDFDDLPASTPADAFLTELDDDVAAFLAELY